MILQIKTLGGVEEFDLPSATFAKYAARRVAEHFGCDVNDATSEWYLVEANQTSEEIEVVEDSALIADLEGKTFELYQSHSLYRYEESEERFAE